MAYLVINYPTGQKEKFDIYKRLTVIGNGPDADITIKDQTLDKIAAYISQTARGFTLVTPSGKAPAYINTIPTTKHDLSENVTFTLGVSQCQFFLFEESKDIEETKEQTVVKAYKRMLEFSQRVALEKDIEKLLATLLKEITQLTGAEHSFLVLLEDGKPKIRVQENSIQENSSLSPMSDSIVKKVIATKEALVVNDALHDKEFSGSLSVINYRLSSVMCTPLTYQGHTFGAIYVSNNSFVNAFDENSLELMTIYSSQAAMLVQNALHIDALKKRTKKLQESLELSKFGGVIGACQGMQNVFAQVEKVAQTDVSVLIVGEAGTGKELIAREIHNRSLRKTNPFIVINCSAIPEALLESELFGHVRGAFSGAVQSKIGKLQAAHLGTLFLDEIGKMPIHLQVKLVQFLQDQKITKLGDNKSDNADVRVIAATDHELLEMVKKNEFREDLYYRLNVFQITVPPLKERGNDVLVLANYFLQKYAKIYGKETIGLSEEAQNALLNYNWPGNVRQLENRIRRAVVMCDHHRINVGDLDLKIESVSGVIPLAHALEQFRARYITESLERNAGNRTKTAHELGVDPRTIFRHLEKKEKDQDDTKRTT